MEQATYTPKDGSKGSHAVFTQKHSLRFCKTGKVRGQTEIKVRHVTAESRPDVGEHTQIEIMLTEIKGDSERMYQTHGHLTLSPETAKALAAALLSSINQ